MQLRSKVIGIILASFLLYGVVESCIHRFIIFPTFVSLEKEEAAKDSKRVSLAIQDKFRHLNTLCHDWAAWDDTYAYTISQSKQYEQSNLVPGSFFNNNLNLLHIYGEKGNKLWGKIRNLETGEDLKLLAFQGTQAPPSLIPTQQAGQPLSKTGMSGIFITEAGPMLIASRPILTSDNKGPVRGTVIMGRLLTDQVIQVLSNQTKIEFEIQTVHPEIPSAPVQAILSRFEGDSDNLIEEANPGFLNVYRKLYDINGDVAFLSKSLVPKTITSLGQTTIRHAIYSTVLTMAFILVGGLLFTRRMVLRPIRRFTDHVMRVGQSGDLSDNFTVTSRDEIGTLSAEFNKMLHSLASTQGQLTEQTQSNHRLKHEIHERKRFEATLRKYKSIIASSSDLIALINRDFTFLIINESGLRAHGLSLEQVVGCHIKELIGDTRFNEALKERLESCLSGETVRFSAWFTYPNLGRRFMDISCFPYIEDNATEGVVVHARDMTEAKLMEDRLFKAQKMDAVGTLAGGIAHDFNNILMGISGRVSLIMFDTAPTSPHHLHLKEMEKYVNSAATLTRQLLGYARGGKNEVQPTDINLLIDASSGMYGRTQKNLKIQTQLHEELWSVEADRSQLDQVLLNLYMNAGQAMPDGGDLTIKTRNVILDEHFVKPYPKLPGKYVKISVTDSGTGMDRATMERVFEPFFTTKRMGGGKGTGLGLASAYGIVKNHNGIIDVSSEKGNGTTFRVYLPASDKSAAVDSHYDSPAQKGDETVLLVDDEPFVAETGKQFLLKLGYNVILARSGETCIDIYKKNRDNISLVILDMIMPGMGGAETYDKLKAIDTKARVLLTSGYSPRGKAEEIMARGCNGFIQKPLRMEELSCKIREIIDTGGITP
ncbi:hypothetical protein DSLASN_20130 [Desulfoluna limicola]|uniref:histidine kinase n=1 Tax=Desulfoluna limicola TaxID=2810562 RepID=A0ABM7PGY3_9BACT|nr:CHASE4 domain-containing protein [Desulfoluna limicola]BCS96381.1 hypothetical protein DSLASN_20130 [Desulfoluna limicola]